MVEWLLTSSFQQGSFLDWQEKERSLLIFASPQQCQKVGTAKEMIMEPVIRFTWTNKEERIGDEKRIMRKPEDTVPFLVQNLFGINILETLIRFSKNYHVTSLATESLWATRSRITSPESVEVTIRFDAPGTYSSTELIKEAPLDKKKEIPSAHAQHEKDKWVGGMESSGVYKKTHFGYFIVKKNSGSWKKSPFWEINSEPPDGYDILVIASLVEHFEIKEKRLNSHRPPYFGMHATHLDQPAELTLWFPTLLGPETVSKSIAGLGKDGLARCKDMTTLVAILPLLGIDFDRFVKNFNSKRADQRPFVKRGKHQ